MQQQTNTPCWLGILAFYYGEALTQKNKDFFVYTGNTKT